MDLSQVSKDELVEELARRIHEPERVDPCKKGVLREDLIIVDQDNIQDIVRRHFEKTLGDFEWGLTTVPDYLDTVSLVHLRLLKDADDLVIPKGTVFVTHNGGECWNREDDPDTIFYLEHDMEQFFE